VLPNYSKVVRGLLADLPIAESRGARPNRPPRNIASAPCSAADDGFFLCQVAVLFAMLTFGPQILSAFGMPSGT